MVTERNRLFFDLSVFFNAHNSFIPLKVGGNMAYTFSKRWSPNYERGNAPRMIIVHHWGADGQSFDAVVNWLCNPNAQVSAHYVLQANKITQLVDLSNKAWHCVGKNGQSIGIECRPECTSGDRKTLAELIASIWKIYGKLPIYGHKDFNSTACPGRYYNYLSSIKADAEKIYSGGSVSPSKEETVAKLSVDGMIGTLSVKALQKWMGTIQDGFISGQDSDDKPYLPSVYAIEYTSGGSDCVKALQKYLTNKKYDCKGIDGYLGQNTVKALQKFLNKEGAKLSVDGYLGTKTAKALQTFLNTR